jgi:hypothetical protein
MPTFECEPLPQSSSSYETGFMADDGGIYIGDELMSSALLPGLALDEDVFFDGKTFAPNYADTGLWDLETPSRQTYKE